MYKLNVPYPALLELFNTSKEKDYLINLNTEELEKMLKDKNTNLSYFIKRKYVSHFNAENGGQDRTKRSNNNNKPTVSNKRDSRSI